MDVFILFFFFTFQKFICSEGFSLRRILFLKWNPYSPRCLLRRSNNKQNPSVSYLLAHVKKWKEQKQRKEQSARPIKFRVALNYRGESPFNIWSRGNSNEITHWPTIGRVRWGLYMKICKLHFYYDLLIFVVDFWFIFLLFFFCWDVSEHANTL